MSINYYGMAFNPFDKEIDTKNAFITNDINEMNGRLDYIKNNPGIAVFTASSGQGKTFSLRCFSDKLNPNITKFAYICLSTVSTAEFYRQLCLQLGLDVQYKKSIMFKSIQEHLENLSVNKRVHQIVCLDEAQYLNTDILRDLKMLTNFSMDSKNCFSLILLGQPVLNNILMRQPHEALRQRIIINYSFGGIEESEAVEYIKNRLLLAGASSSIIDKNAMISAYSSSTGSIRKLNLIMTKALMIGAQHNKKIIDTDIILAAVNEIELI
jgi:type II secretory pathway predicted ATPase ExeA